MSAVVVALVLFTLFSGFKVVPQSEEWTVERLGKYTHTLAPGPHLIVPFINSISAKISKRETLLNIPKQDVISADNVNIAIDAVCFYQVIDTHKAAYRIDNLPAAIRNLVMTNIRTVLGGMELDSILSKRDEMSSKLTIAIQPAVEAWGVKLERIEIADVSPPKDIVESMTMQMKAERSKRAQILEADGHRESQILRAQGDQQSTILRAEGEKQAAFLVSEAREREAKAEAESTRLVSEAIGDGNIQALNYFISQKYIEGMSQLAASDNAKVILMPVELTQLAGTVAGISELIKSGVKTKT